MERCRADSESANGYRHIWSPRKHDPPDHRFIVELHDDGEGPSDAGIYGFRTTTHATASHEGYLAHNETLSHRHQVGWRIELSFDSNFGGTYDMLLAHIASRFTYTSSVFPQYPAESPGLCFVSM